MRRKTSLKLAVLIPVVYTTWVVSSGLMAQQFKATRTEVVRDTETPAVQPPDDDSTRVPVHMTYEYKTKGFDVQVIDDQVRVSCSIEMLDRKGDRSYLWRLQSFKDGIAEPTVDIPYLTQMFAIADRSKTMTPTFADAFQPPQGTHRVFLTLYGVPNGYDTTQLDDPAKAKSAALLKYSREIVIR